MGQLGIAAQNKCCCKKPKEASNEYVPLVQDLREIQIDQEYFNHEQWYIKEPSKLFFSPEKFIFLYSGYKSDHEEMNKHWDKLDIRLMIKHGTYQRKNNYEVLALKWKYLIRKGVPMNLMKTIILDIFKRTFTENQMEYNIALKIIFKDQIPVTNITIPNLFYDNIPIEEVVKFTLLNQKGFESLKRILWILKEMYHQIDYNIMVVQVATLLLIFLSEQETYCVLKLMIEDSSHILNDKKQISLGEEEISLRWHFLIKKGDFVQFVKSFVHTVSTKSNTFKEILNHFRELGFDYVDLFMDMINSILSGYLTFSTVIQIFAMFMNEGIKIYFRFMYALCRVAAKDILKVRDISTMKSLIRKLGLNLTRKQTKDMIKRAFSLRLGKANKQMQKSIPEGEKDLDQKIYYIPHLGNESNIINQEQLEILWSWLPEILKLSDGIQIWNTLKDGTQLQRLYEKCSQYSDKQMLLIIKADNNSVFGVFCDSMLKSQSEGYFGGSETFLFQLKPHQKIFETQPNETTQAYCCGECFTFGSQGVALMVDSNLYQGSSEYSITYKNEVLTGDPLKLNFICSQIEVYTFE